MSMMMPTGVQSRSLKNMNMSIAHNGPSGFGFNVSVSREATKMKMVNDHMDRAGDAKMMADGASPFFDFKIGMLDGSGEKTMKELTDGAKAILLVNVASV